MMPYCERIKHCVFRPYRMHLGPTFTLDIYDINRVWDGKQRLGYVLKMDKVTLFEGNDFGCAPTHAIDSNATVKALMSFLCLRPGDTDKEYFKKYTPEQLAFCRDHAEALSFYVSECWRVLANERSINP